MPGWIRRKHDPRGCLLLAGSLLLVAMLAFAVYLLMFLIFG